MTGDKLLGEVDIADEEATRRFASRLAPYLVSGDVLALEGDLGAGKTAFSRALINALPSGPGQVEKEEVPSPTFTLVQIYDRADLQVWHFDLYRLEDPEEAYELDIEEAFVEGISLIEWPDKLGFLMPSDRLLVNLKYGKNDASRVLSFVGNAKWHERLNSFLNTYDPS
ncbi:tRNA (adenosine(37)-N6)-threonylcarbamoyltransferase complex ATPase subunit type 1 TsaE [Kiloniella sp.]|uniref:tRNA (adenosine(37)-N6)-threonylcarbamoyltransferase complex ATPase subunit type 1 TsaE n=1 Tax=Kiloniella sp. TaxID=1938587 RepID=UPI003B01F063